MDFSLKKVNEISRELAEFAELLEEMQKKSEFDKLKEDSNYSLEEKLKKVETDIEILRTGLMNDNISKKVNALKLEQLKKQHQKIHNYQ
ncbi:hypothetical protein LJ207_08090 [Halanaerobium sp. Z-7514]|uniref:Uncharacterized protein n=1 Tax=Halanaerobium polyolivorans TaxID=2886943 RepID=A0AAW4X0F3_9FIRM|nr:hypothetical protein [Halanaerobium polyolivorans]MCC3145280.1 hypothetical protein [Halanaerobium polyolivorans]